MSKEMMICKLGHTIPLSSPICDDRCSDYHLRRGKCINLIPYIPEQPTTCPECGHPVRIHHRFGCQARYPVCACKRTPADLQPELTLETLQEACSKMLVVDDSPYSKPEMPLSTVSEEIQAWVNEFGGERDALNIALARLSLANAIINRLKQQIDSSTNNEAHDSAVASKARQFLVAKIIGRYADTLSPEAIRDIRAMAEGEE